MREVLSALAVIIGLIGGGAGITGLALIRSQRKLLGATAHHENADAEVALSASAIARMTAAENRAAAAEHRADQAIADVQRMRRKFYAYELWADQHRVWDQEAQSEVNAHGGHLRPPPQLVIINDA